MRSLSEQQRKRVDACTGGVSGKLDELRELHARIGDLCNSAKELHQSFGNEDARFRADFKVQIESLERFKGEIVFINALRDRLKVEQEKVEDYERRIDKVQAKIEKQKEMEAGKKRVSCESSILEGTGQVPHSNGLRRENEIAVGFLGDGGDTVVAGDGGR